MKPTGWFRNGLKAYARRYKRRFIISTRDARTAWCELVRYPLYIGTPTRTEWCRTTGAWISDFGWSKFSTNGLYFFVWS